MTGRSEARLLIEMTRVSIKLLPKAVGQFYLVSLSGDINITHGVNVM